MTKHLSKWASEKTMAASRLGFHQIQIFFCPNASNNKWIRFSENNFGVRCTLIVCLIQCHLSWSIYNCGQQGVLERYTRFHSVSLIIEWLNNICVFHVIHETCDKLKKSQWHKMNLLSFTNYRDKAHLFIDMLLCWNKNLSNTWHTAVLKNKLRDDFTFPL